MRAVTGTPGCVAAARALLPLLAALLLLSGGAAAQPLEVVQLTPANFEHETQAATGQTTGHWCVLFLNSSAASGLSVAAEDAWEALAGDENKATILAKVDVAAPNGDALAKRFNLTTSPAAVLFRDRSMYPLELAPGGGADADAVAALVHAFMDGGYEHQVPHPVPAEVRWMDKILDDVAGMMQVNPNPMLYAGVACMALGVLFFVGVALVGTYYLYAPITPARKPPAAAAAAAGAAKPKAEPAAAAAAGGDAAGDEEGDEDEAGVVKGGGEARATRARRRA